MEIVRKLPFAHRLYDADKEPGRYPFLQRGRLRISSRREFAPWSLITLAILGSLPEGAEPPTVLDGEGRLLIRRRCWVPASCKLLSWPSRAGLRLERWEVMAAYLLLSPYETCGAAAKDARREAARRLPCAVTLQLLGGDAVRARAALEDMRPRSVKTLWWLGF